MSAGESFRQITWQNPCTKFLAGCWRTISWFRDHQPSRERNHYGSIGEGGACTGNVLVRDQCWYRFNR